MSGGWCHLHRENVSISISLAYEQDSAGEHHVRAIDSSVLFINGARCWLYSHLRWSARASGSEYSACWERFHHKTFWLLLWVLKIDRFKRGLFRRMSQFYNRTRQTTYIFRVLFDLSVSSYKMRDQVARSVANIAQSVISNSLIIVLSPHNFGDCSAH